MMLFFALFLSTFHNAQAATEIDLGRKQVHVFLECRAEYMELRKQLQQELKRVEALPSEQLSEPQQSAVLFAKLNQRHQVFGVECTSAKTIRENLITDLRHI